MDLEDKDNNDINKGCDTCLFFVIKASAEILVSCKHYQSRKCIVFFVLFCFLNIGC